MGGYGDSHGECGYGIDGRLRDTEVDMQPFIQLDAWERVMTYGLAGVYLTEEDGMVEVVPPGLEVVIRTTCTQRVQSRNHM